MQWNKSGRDKAPVGEFEQLLKQMLAYTRSQIEAGEPYVIPKLAAAYLNLPEGDAFVLLRMLASRGLIEQIFNVYCKEDGILLASVDRLEELDHLPHCDDCDLDHTPDEVTLEIAFRPHIGVDLRAA